MKTFKSILLLALSAGTLLAPFRLTADDAKPDDKTDPKLKPKPYVLTTCLISGEKLGGDMGEPYVFIYKDKKIKDDVGRQIKFCCKDCLKDFNKTPAKYLKKLDKAEAELKAKDKDKKS